MGMKNEASINIYEAYEEAGISVEERARRLCEVLERELRKMGVVTTAHYEAGPQSHIIRALEAAAQEECDRHDRRGHEE